MQKNKGAVSNTKTGETGKDFYIEQKISSYASRIDAELLRNGKEEAAPKDSFVGEYSTKEEALDALEGIDPVFEFDHESGRYYRTDCTVFTFLDEYIASTEEYMEQERIARRISKSGEWPMEDCQALCELAGIENEWNIAGPDQFESVVIKAARILNVDIGYGYGNDSPEKGNNPRTFGLYTIPSSNLIFRKMDGVWEALFCFTRIGSSADVWKYYSTQKGKPVDKDFIESHEGLQCLTYQRSVARFLYGVPQDVELYPDPDFSIIKDPKKPHKRKGR